MRRKLAQDSFEEKSQKVGRLIALSATVKLSAQMLTSISARAIYALIRAQLKKFWLLESDLSFDPIRASFPRFGGSQSCNLITMANSVWSNLRPMA